MMEIVRDLWPYALPGAILGLVGFGTLLYLEYRKTRPYGPPRPPCPDPDHVHDFHHLTDVISERRVKNEGDRMMEEGYKVGYELYRCECWETRRDKFTESWSYRSRSRTTRRGRK